MRLLLLFMLTAFALGLWAGRRGRAGGIKWLIGMSFVVGVLFYSSRFI